LLKRADLQSRTPRTLTEPSALLAQLDTIRAQGYAVDDGEQEIGVRCVAVTVPDTPIASALSISGPAARITHEVVADVAPQLQQAAARLSAELRS
ncbi:MAG: IclR family transcriptional regulator domain-containing protein, partial [Micromonosporaceae bacterium]